MKKIKLWENLNKIRSLNDWEDIRQGGMLKDILKGEVEKKGGREDLDWSILPRSRKIWAVLLLEN